MTTLPHNFFQVETPDTLDGMIVIRRGPIVIKIQATWGFGTTVEIDDDHAKTSRKMLVGRDAVVGETADFVRPL